MSSGAEQPNNQLTRSVPLWAVFAVDPAAATTIVNAEACKDTDEQSRIYATASNLADHLRRARLLAEFLEAGVDKHDAMLSTARDFVRVQDQADETFSHTDIPAI